MRGKVWKGATPTKINRKPLPLGQGASISCWPGLARPLGFYSELTQVLPETWIVMRAILWGSKPPAHCETADTTISEQKQKQQACCSGFCRAQFPAPPAPRPSLPPRSELRLEPSAPRRPLPPVRSVGSSRPQPSPAAEGRARAAGQPALCPGVPSLERIVAGQAPSSRSDSARWSRGRSSGRTYDRVSGAPGRAGATGVGAGGRGRAGRKARQVARTAGGGDAGPCLRHLHPAPGLRVLAAPRPRVTLGPRAGRQLPAPSTLRPASCAHAHLHLGKKAAGGSGRGPERAQPGRGALAESAARTHLPELRCTPSPAP